MGVLLHVTTYPPVGWGKYTHVASYHISAQVCLCVCGARMENVSVCVVRVHVTLSVLACAAKHDLRTCKIEM